MEKTIRRAIGADALAIAQLHADSWRFTYRGMMSDEYLDQHVEEDRQRVWRARLDAPTDLQRVLVLELPEIPPRIVGFICVYLNADAALGAVIDNIHVHASHRGAGNGECLMMAARDICAVEAPERPIHLWVLESNRQAIDFYRKLGGTHCGSDTWSAPDGSLLPSTKIGWTNHHTMRRVAHATELRKCDQNDSMVCRYRRAR